MASTDSNDKDPLVSYVVSEFERYEKFHGDRFEEAKEIIKHWNNEPPRRDFEWQNRVHVPMTFEGEQTITPRIFAALFPDEAPIEVMVESGAPEDGIVIRDHLRHHFRVSEVQTKAIPALQQTTLLGTGYIHAPWVYRKAWQVSPEGRRYEAVVANRPDCEWVDFFEMFPHPAKISIDDDLPIIRRRYCDAEFLKRLARNPRLSCVNLAEALKSEPVMEYKSVILDDKGNFMDIKKREQYEILEYWGPWHDSFKDDRSTTTQMGMPYWVMVVNRAVKIKASENPYNHQTPPFCKMTLYSSVKPSFFGVGLGKVGKPTQERINKIVNNRLDNVDLVLNKQGCYDGNDNLINVKRLRESKPGAWHKVTDTVTSLRWIDTPDVTASSYKEEEVAKNDFRESTGATIPLMPTDEGQHRTSSGINLLQSAAGVRFKPVLRKIESEFIQRLAFMYLSNLQQFMVIPEWITMTSEDGSREPILVTPEQIQRKVKFIPTGITETMNKELQIGQLMRFKEITMNDPTINRAEINKRIAELLGFKDIHKIIADQNPAQAGPGQLDPQTQQLIQQRLREGATPEQIKMELLGNPPPQPPAGPENAG